jgi:hypothetical protein
MSHKINRSKRPSPKFLFLHEKPKKGNIQSFIQKFKGQRFSFEFEGILRRIILGQGFGLGFDERNTNLGLGLGLEKRNGNLRE